MATRNSKGAAKSSSGDRSLDIAVDVGRSSVKIAFLNRTMSFPFLVATKKAATADYFVSTSAIRKVATVDGAPYFFGEDATLFGDSVIQYTEGDIFREASVAVTLFSIAYAMYEGDAEQPKVNLAINLTFDNFYQKEAYAKALKGKHSVKFTVEDETFDFFVDRVFVLYQGFSGLISTAMDDAFHVNKNFLPTEGVVIDVGRQTIDFLYIERFVVKHGSSKDFGTFKIYEKAVDLLKREHSIIKEPYEIEELLSTGKAITPLHGGDKVHVEPLIKKAVAFYFSDVQLHFETFLSKKNPDYILLLGGGAIVYGPFFKEKYKIVEIPAEPQFSNSRGMLKFLAKAVQVKS